MMDLQHPGSDLIEEPWNQQPYIPDPQEVLQQLNRIVASIHFRNSKRYPAMLRFVVEEVLAGRAEALKERTLGAIVFGRDPDYDTNADPVVRVSAGEIRKRIAQYYQMPGREDELRFDLPLGTYVPQFKPAPDREHQIRPAAEKALAPSEAERDLTTKEAEDSTSSAASSLSPAMLPASDAPFLSFFRDHRAKTVGLAVTCLLPVIAVFSGARFKVTEKSARANQEPAFSLFWDPMLKSSEAALFVLGVHSFDQAGNDISSISHASLPQPDQSLLSTMTRYDMISLGDVISYNQIASILTKHNHVFETKGAAETNLKELGQGPVILIGGFNNMWTERLGGGLRFRFVTIHHSVNVIEDSQNPDLQWTVDTSQSALKNARDYGIVASFFNPEIEQQVMIVAGIGKSGTEAGADFVSNARELDAWFSEARVGGHTNVEVVFYTDVVEGNHGPPHVIDSYFW